MKDEVQKLSGIIKEKDKDNKAFETVLRWLIPLVKKEQAMNKQYKTEIEYEYIKTRILMVISILLFLLALVLSIMLVVAYCNISNASAYMVDTYYSARDLTIDDENIFRGFMIFAEKAGLDSILERYRVAQVLFPEL